MDKYFKVVAEQSLLWPIMLSVGPILIAVTFFIPENGNTNI